MKYIFLYFLFLAGGCLQRENLQILVMEKDRVIRYSECINKYDIKSNIDDSYNPFAFIRSIKYFNDQTPTGIWITQSIPLTNLLFFENGKACRIIYYNIWGETVADCTLKDEKPSNGTIWHLSWGSRKGVKSLLITYKNGVIINSQSYREEELSLLFDNLGKLYRPKEKDIYAVCKFYW